MCLNLFFLKCRLMKDKRELLIDSAVGGLAAAMSATNPVLGIVGSAFAPTVASAAKSLLPKALGEREQQRVEHVFIRSIEKIRLMLDNGEMPRDDESYHGVTSMGIPKAQEILEGVLLKARDEFQSKKLEFYSSFFANLCFDESISFEHANFLLNALERLSYRQLCILSYLSDEKAIPTSRWDAVFKTGNNKELLRYFDLYSEYIDLYNARMIVQTTKVPGFALGMSDTNISSLGLSIVRLADLASIPKEDVESIGHYLEAIEAIISRG